MKALAFIDIEATSAHPDRADIIEIAFIVKNHQGEVIDHFHSLVKPTRLIPKDIVELTGITDQMVANAPEFNEIAEKVFLKLRNTKLVAHKAEFDREILKTKFNQLGLIFQNDAFCTLKASQRLAPGMTSHSLTALCSFFSIPLKKNHRAMDDAEATLSLYQILSLLSGKEDAPKTYLKNHKKLIERARPIPGILYFMGKDGEVFYEKAVENLKRELQEKLELKSSNQALIAKCRGVKVEETASFAKAMLLQSKKEKPSWSIYSFKNKSGAIIVKCGRTISNKKALLYFEKKQTALATLKSIQKAAQSQTYAYKETSAGDKSEIMKKNAQLKKALKKLKPSLENILFRSQFKIGGLYQYVLVKGNDHYATFEHDLPLEKGGDFLWERFQFKNLRPSSRRALELSLQYIKNQKRKTDIVVKLKRPS